MLNYDQLMDYLLAGGKITLSADPTKDKPFSVAYSRVFDGGGSTYATPEELAAEINQVTNIVERDVTKNTIKKIKEARTAIASLKRAIEADQPFSTEMENTF